MSEEMSLKEAIEVVKKSHPYATKYKGVKEDEALQKLVEVAELLEQVEKEKLKINFKCGCFTIFYITERLTLQGGLTCCEKHEHPNAKLEDYYLADKP